MINRQTLIRTTLAAGLIASLAACGQMRPQNKIDIYQATLSNAQEVPPAAGGGGGQAEVQLNKNNNTIKWKVTYSGLTGAVTAAHIHGPAPVGQNAGVVVPFTGNMNAQPMEGEATITPEQVTQLVNGQWYVNIHTARFPGGEIRGQLRERR